VRATRTACTTLPGLAPGINRAISVNIGSTRVACQFFAMSRLRTSLEPLARIFLSRPDPPHDRRGAGASLGGPPAARSGDARPASRRPQPDLDRLLEHDVREHPADRPDQSGADRVGLRGGLNTVGLCPPNDPTRRPSPRSDWSPYPDQLALLVTAMPSARLRTPADGEDVPRSSVRPL
jgi:hypothetical protein